MKNMGEKIKREKLDSVKMKNLHPSKDTIDRVKCDLGTGKMLCKPCAG